MIFEFLGSPGRWAARPPTGLQVSELTSLDCADVTLGASANLRCGGKGQKSAAPR